MKWIRKIIQVFKPDKRCKVFVSYTWDSETKSGSGNSVIVMNRLPTSWEDILVIKNNIAEWNLKDYPGVSVMILHYCEMR